MRYKWGLVLALITGIGLVLLIVGGVVSFSGLNSPLGLNIGYVGLGMITTVLLVIAVGGVIGIIKELLTD